MNQSNLPSRDWGVEIDRNRGQVAKRLRQIYACLAHLSSPGQTASKDIPEEAAIEIQHALSHLALMSDTESAEQKARRWHQALAHLNRAVIDFLKLFTLDIFHQKCSSSEFMRSWLETRQKEYWEHASGTQSPSLMASSERELFTIEAYKKLLDFSMDESSLDFTAEDLKGDKWKKYSIELDNWMNSDLMFGGIMGQKNVENLEQLLTTLWYLDTDLLAEYNYKTQIETLRAISNMGLANDWSGSLWSEINSILANPYQATKDNILIIYRRFIEYFGVKPWSSLTIGR